jgi:hypothetical protein
MIVLEAVIVFVVCYFVALAGVDLWNRYVK